MTPDQVFHIFFTKNFAQTADITKALSLPFILYVILSLPTLFLLYTVKKPAIILFSNVIMFAIVSAGSYVLIPKLGVFGPPYALAAAFFVSLIILTSASLREYRKIT